MSCSGRCHFGKVEGKKSLRPNMGQSRSFHPPWCSKMFMRVLLGSFLSESVQQCIAGHIVQTKTVTLFSGARALPDTADWMGGLATPSGMHDAGASGGHSSHLTRAFAERHVLGALAGRRCHKKVAGGEGSATRLQKSPLLRTHPDTPGGASTVTGRASSEPLIIGIRHRRIEPRGRPC